MELLTPEDLLSLEKYSETRSEFRTTVMAHKKPRRIALGKNATLYFEDRLTMQYQIQEMLRIERIFERDGIMEELETYNPMIPTGTNLKATFMLEYPDINERKKALASLIGIDKKLWVQVDGFDKVFAITNEDLTRETEDKTSSVHFARFELTDAMVQAAKSGASLSVGVDHENYTHAVSPLPDENNAVLVADFD